MPNATEHWLDRGPDQLLTRADLADEASPDWFNPQRWGRAARAVSDGGRGSAWFLEHGDQQWVLRHYRRGGLPGRLIHRDYLFLGRDRVRSVREFRLLNQLHREGLPVPRPVSAYYRRRGPIYRAALLIERLVDTRPLSTFTAPEHHPLWTLAGRCLRRFHEAGVEHADLNATNILVHSDSGRVFLIDFDRGRRHRQHRPDAPWKAANLRRLERGLYKHWPQNARTGPESLLEALLTGYREATD